MAAPQPILYGTFDGSESGATNTLAAGANSSLPFGLASGQGQLLLGFTKGSITSFVAYLQLYDPHRDDWANVYDSSGTLVSLFGTVNATLSPSRAYPIWIGGARLPDRTQMRVSVVVTGTPAASDVIRIAVAAAA